MFKSLLVYYRTSSLLLECKGHKICSNYLIRIISMKIRLSKNGSVRLLLKIRFITHRIREFVS